MLVDIIPAHHLTPGTAFAFTWTRAAQGLVPLPQAIALVGVQSGNAPVEQAVLVRTAKEAADRFGEGCELALMAETAFATGVLFGQMPQVYAVPLAPPSGDPAVTKLAVSGPAMESGRVRLRIAGMSITAPVSAGHDAATVAEAIDSAIATARSLPITTTRTAGDVFAKHRTAGVHGNDVMFDLVEAPAGITIDITQTTDGTGDAVITGALDRLLALDVNGIALANHQIADATAAAEHAAIAWQAQRKRWRHMFLATTGNTSTAGALAALDQFSLVIGACKQARSLPGQIAAFLATIAFATGSPNYNLAGYSKAPLYAPDPVHRYSPLEVEELLQLGVTPLEAVANRPDRLAISRLVTSQRTLSGAPTQQLVDASISMTSAYLARQLDVAYKRNFGPDSGDPRTVTDELLDQVRDVVIDTLRAAEKAGYIRHLDRRMHEIAVREHEQVAGRLIVQVPLAPTPQLMQLAFAMNVYS